MNEQHTRAPHNSGEDRGRSPNAALFIDFDNVTMGVRSNLGQELRSFLNSDVIRGKVAVQRAYADWRRYPQYVVPLSEASVDLIYAPAYGSSKKNATDIRLAIDALEVVFTRPEIGTYILLSGDSDFSSLVLKLKEYGKYVIGVGMQESSSELLVQNCDEYYSYDALSGLVSADEVKTEKHDPWELVEQAVKKMHSRNDVMRSDRLKQVMLELDSSFDEKELGYSKFNRFLTEASSRGLLDLQRIGNGQYEVGPAGGGSPAASREEAPSGVTSGQSSRGDGGRRSGRGGGRPQPEPPEPIAETDSLKAAYDLLQDVVKELADPETPVRDSEVKRRILERDSDFDEATLGFSKFSRFLRQAYDEGIITLIKGDEGNYYLQTVDRTEPEATPAGSGRSGRERGGREPEPEQVAPAEPREPEEAEPREPEEEAAGAGDSEASAAEPRPSLLTRRGRGGRRSGAGKKDSSGPETVPGPASSDAEDDRDGNGEPVEEETEAPPAAASDEPEGSRPTGIGRFRRGRRGGARGRSPGGKELAVGNVAGSAGSSDRQDAGSGAGESASGRPDAKELVTYMAENYPGVGERTARALVEEFGDRTLEIIDREPGRVKELLPRHRAEAVLEARAEERGQAAG